MSSASTGSCVVAQQLHTCASAQKPHRLTEARRTASLHRHEDLSSALRYPHRKLAWWCVSVASALGMQRPGGESFCEEELRGSLGKFLRPCLKRKNTVVAGGWDSSVIESFLSRQEALGSNPRGGGIKCMYRTETVA